MKCKWCGRVMTVSKTTVYCSPKCESIAEQVKEDNKRHKQQKQSTARLVKPKQHRQANRRREIQFENPEAWRKKSLANIKLLSNHPHAVRKPV